MASWLMKNVKDGSLMKGVKDGSRRLKDEIARSIGAGADGGVDPVLEHRTQRFNRYNDRLEDLSRAMTQYTNAMRTYAQATAQLMHAFSAFFEFQMEDAHGAATSCGQLSRVQSLAQSSLRVEEIQQSLQENVFDVAQSMQLRTVMQPIQELRASNATLSQQLRALKQKVSDFDSAQRNTETQRRSPLEFEKAQQRLQAAAASLSLAAESVDADMTVIEARRDSALKNELLTVVAAQIFVYTRANEHFQQLVPLLPGVAKPLVLLLAESARRRRPTNPATSDVMGVISYCGKYSQSTLEEPLRSHREALADVAAVHPIAIGPFKKMHFAERMAFEAYSRREQQDN